MSASTVSKRPARVVVSRHGGQDALMLLALPVTVSYLPLQSADAGRLFSQLSSAVSASDPFARFLWQPRMHLAALPRLFATEFSHFAKPLFDVMNPPSSPPNGVCAMANPTTSMAANPPTNANLLTMCLTSWEPAARAVSPVRIPGPVFGVQLPLARRQLQNHEM